ncbi:MAG: CNNM domain-containing protein [Planctomycetaceae bacterium]
MGCLIIGSGFFSASETAFFYLTHDKIREFASGNFRQRLVARLMSDPERLLTAVLFWNLMINLMYFAVSVIVVHRLSNAKLNVAAGVFGAVSLMFMILIGEVLPKSTAVVFRNSLAPLAAIPLAATVRVLDPLIPTLERISTSIRNWLWPDLEDEPVLSISDMEHAIEASKKTADVGVAEQHVLQNIIELSDLKAEELMRPRGMFATRTSPVSAHHLSDLDPQTDIVAVMDQSNERVVGAISIDSRVGPPAETTKVPIENVVTVPWCGSLTSTLQLMRKEYARVAVVVSEYDLPVGIITYTDLMDAILVPQTGRTKRLLKREPVVEIKPGHFEVEGITTLRYLNKRLGLEHDPELDASLTVAGLLQDKLHERPEVGQYCEWKDWRVTVIEASAPGQIKALLHEETYE